MTVDATYAFNFFFQQRTNVHLLTNKHKNVFIQNDKYAL